MITCVGKTLDRSSWAHTCRHMYKTPYKPIHAACFPYVASASLPECQLAYPSDCTPSSLSWLRSCRKLKGSKRSAATLGWSFWRLCFFGATVRQNPGVKSAACKNTGKNKKGQGLGKVPDAPGIFVGAKLTQIEIGVAQKHRLWQAGWLWKDSKMLLPDLCWADGQNAQMAILKALTHLTSLDSS